MVQTIILRRSPEPGKIPTATSLQLGEIAINTSDGKMFIAKTGVTENEIIHVLTTNTYNTGNLNLGGNIVLTGGTYSGDGSDLYNIPYSGITGITNTDNWSLDGNALTTTKNIGSTTDFDVNFIRSGITQYSLTNNGISSNVAYNSGGNITIEKGNPRLKLRDTGHSTHTQGFDLYVSVDEFIIDDNTHNRNILKNHIISTTHHTDFDSDVFNFISGSTIYATINNSGLTLSNILAESTDVDKFLVTNGGLIKYRTGTQLLSDIGAFATPTGLTTNYITKWNGTKLVNSLAFDNGDNFVIGTNTDIDTYSRMYVFGGSNGANIDARPGGGGYDQAIIDLQGSDYATNFNSVHLRYQGINAVGTTLGYSNKNLADLTYNYASGDRAFLIRSVGISPIVFAVDNEIKGNFGISGLTLSNILAESTDVDKFLVTNGGLIKYRTGTQLLSDIGATPLNGTGASGTWGISITGNAATVTNGVYTTDSILIARSNIGSNQDWNIYTTAGIYSVGTGSWTGSSNAPTSAYQYGQLHVFTYGNTVTQIYYTHGVAGHFIRSKYNSSDWVSWQEILTNTNFNEYIPTLTGTGASGTWGISVTGNAGTATTLQTARTLTIGNTGRSFDGSQALTWSINDIGAVATTSFINLGTQTFTNSTTTSNLITELNNKGAFVNDGYSITKASWDYAGNNDLTDTGFGTIELAGSVIQVYQDSSGYKHMWLTRPTAGTGGFKMLVYNDQGPGYGPGWKEIITNEVIGTYAPTLTGTGASGTWGVSITGNAATATTLQTARTINGVSFNGSSNITVPSLYDTNYRRITNPGGGEYTTGSSSVTGAIKIIFPFGITAYYPMMKITIKVYEYVNGESFDIVVAGHMSGTLWYNTSAYIIGQPDTERQFTVRFGGDATNAVIYIGELNSTWSYPQVFITEIQVGYNSFTSAMTTGWSIGFETSTFVNISKTHTNPQVGWYTESATPHALVKRDASGNIYSNYAFSGYVNTTDDVATGTISHIIAKFGDNYHRSTTPSHFISQLALVTTSGTGASGTWGISITGNAATSTRVNGMYGQLISKDDRTIEPNSIDGTTMQFGFTSFNNDNSSPYADYLHLRSYQDSSGGDDNLLMFNKSGLGIRIWQRQYGSATAYSVYKDVAWTDGSNASGTWGISITGNAVTAGGLGVHNTQSTQNNANQILRTTNDGYTYLGWINTVSGDNGTTAINRIYASEDNFIRYYTPTNFRTVLDVPTRTGGNASGTWGISVTGNAATVTNGMYTNSNSSISGDNYITFGPNSSWSSYLRIGGNGRTVTGESYASIVTTNGNVHIDSGTSRATYINYYSGTGGVVFGNGALGQVAWMNASGDLFRGGTQYVYNSGTWGISTTGNAATATTLQTARTINGISFNGSANILIPSLYDSNYRRITNPGGGEYVTTSSAVTGAIRITFPVTFCNTMLRMTVKVYQYNTGKSFDINIGGYIYGSSVWYNTFAYIIAQPNVERQLTVRFGGTTNPIIYIGELGSEWDYPQIMLTNLELGYSGQSVDWTTGWLISFETSSFNNITNTHSNPQIGYGTTTATANALVLRDGGGDINSRYSFASYHNSSDDVPGGNITYVMAKFGDNYYRSATAAKVASFITNQSMNIVGTSTNITAYTINQNVGTNNDVTFSTANAYYFRNRYDVSVDANFGLYFNANADTSYAIYRESGGWSSPFPDLRIAFHTGIKIGAQTGYGGIRFYNTETMSTQLMSVGDGDGYVRVAQYLYVGQYLNVANGNNENPTIGQIWTSNNSDTYLRKSTSAHFISQLGLITTSNYSSYAVPIGGATLTNIFEFRSNLGGYLGTLSAAPLQVHSTSNNSAFMSFHKAGNYAVNMGLDADNVFRIGGWSAAANRLQLDMSGNLTIAGTLTEQSSLKYKENIFTLEDALEKVLQLRPVKYNIKGDKKVEIGLIAEEVQELIPELIKYDSKNEIDSLSYTRLAAILVEAIKEQQKQINILKEKINNNYEN